MAGLRNLSAPISIINLESEPNTRLPATRCLQAYQPHTLSPAPKSEETQEDLAGSGEGAQAGGEESSDLKVLLAAEVVSMNRSNLALRYITLLYLARNFGSSLPYNSQLHYQWAQVKIWVQS